MSRVTKAELQEKVDVLGALLFEGVHLFRTEDYSDEDREELIKEYLERCRQAGFV